jgi:hypothetical protein
MGGGGGSRSIRDKKLGSQGYDEEKLEEMRCTWLLVLIKRNITSL